jgi:hypothetical protein
MRRRLLRMLIVMKDVLLGKDGEVVDIMEVTDTMDIMEVTDPMEVKDGSGERNRWSKQKLGSSCNRCFHRSTVHSKLTRLTNLRIHHQSTLSEITSDILAMDAK